MILLPGHILKNQCVLYPSALPKECASLIAPHYIKAGIYFFPERRVNKDLREAYSNDCFLCNATQYVCGKGGVV